MQHERTVCFGPYRLFRSRKVLLEHNRPVALGSRAFDILIALVERSGEVVSKNELMKYAWPGLVVEENNLRVHVAAIRKILGDGQGNARYILNVAGRGYSFIAPVSLADEEAAVGEARSAVADGLPGPVTHIVGRDEVISAVVAQMSKQRHISIIGPGGVGKTTVAVAVALQLKQSGLAIRFFDLSVIKDPSLVISTLAAMLGISAFTEDPTSNLIAYLRDLRLLLVFDNCEHVIASIAVLAERLLSATEGIRILATSREPILSIDEYVVALAPLVSPPVTPTLDATKALTFPAIQLFVERAIGGLDTFSLTDENANTVAGICRRLDGMPLAIELVAARISTLGIDALSKGFGDDMLLAVPGRRTAGRRHQSLRATLDWSYELLSPLEQTVLRRLAVFTGAFSSEAAAGVVSGSTVTTSPILNALMSLVAKSLLTVDISGATIRYRLLHTTKAYATERLTNSDEMSEMLRRHAKHCCVMLDAAAGNWDHMTRPEWLSRYGGLSDDVRAATDWAFSPRGTLDMAVDLTVASIPFGFQLSLIDETIKRAKLVLDIVSRASPPQPLSVMRLDNALSGVLLLTGVSDEEVFARAGRTLAMARQLDDPRACIQPLVTQIVVQIQQGKFDAAVNTTEALDRVAAQTDDGIASLLADRVGAQSQHFFGNHDRARTLAERVLRHPAPSIPLRYNVIAVDRRVSMRIILARIAWLSGRADQAKAIAAEATELSLTDGPASICQALGMAACPIAFWMGDLPAAVGLVQQLLDYSRRSAFSRWTQLALCYERSLGLLSGTPPVSLRAEDMLDDTVPDGAFFRETLATISDEWIDQPTLERARLGLCGWAGPEILRAAAVRELATSRSSTTFANVTAACELAVTTARAQQAVAWQLRSTYSLAQVRVSEGNARAAAALLRDVLSTLPPAPDTPDRIAACRLLSELQED
jgi:predicted ATPase/DNA-binding winged helix-turn-helix (wHTH) protein